jgi:hypothetical protein
MVYGVKRQFTDSNGSGWAWASSILPAVTWQRRLKHAGFTTKGDWRWPRMNH